MTDIDALFQNRGTHEIAATPEGACLTIVPTYTAMLTTRDLLARRTGREAFWQ